MTVKDPYFLLSTEAGPQQSEMRMYPDGAVVIMAAEWGVDREDGIEFRFAPDKLMALTSLALRNSQPLPTEAEALARHIEAQDARTGSASEYIRPMGGAELLAFLGGLENERLDAVADRLGTDISIVADISTGEG